MTRCWLFLVAIILALAGFSPAAPAQQWTRFRGPNGAGVQSGVDLPAAWSDGDYRWKVDLPGVGHSSPILWGDRLFVTAGDEESGERIIRAIDAGSGATRWTKRYTAAHHGKHKLNSFASPTPVVDAQRLIVCWGTPEAIEVVALDHNGNEQWRADLGPFKASHGFGVSPILFEDLVILPVEHQGESFIAALEADSGDIRWRTNRASDLHYATPCLMSRGGAEELICVNWRDGVAALDPRTGKTNWSLDVFDKGHIESSISSPVVAGDLVIGVCGWLGYGNEVIAVRPPQGDKPAEQVWRITRGAPLCVTPIVVGQLLFLWTDNGIVTCADAARGDVYWTKRVGGTFYSSPVSDRGKLYNVSTDGRMVVLAAASKYQELADFELGEGSHATPAIADDVMYVRTFTKLMALGKEK